MFKEIKLQPLTEEQQEILIALLASEGYDSFHQEEDHLLAYILNDQYEADQLDQVLKGLGWMDIRVDVALLEDKNWNAYWESNFPPVFVEDKILVKAPFHQIDRPSEYEIEIMPKMSFGTGHHATTYMMLKQMYNMSFDGKKVFDFGCGTAVLAIFAAMKKAGYVFGVDHEAWAYENALENVERNGYPEIEIDRGSVEKAKGKSFDIILANINLNVIQNSFEALVEMLLPGGILLVSGILLENIATLKTLGNKFDIEYIIEDHRSNWAIAGWKKAQ